MCVAIAGIREEGRLAGLSEGRLAGLSEGRLAGLSEGRHEGRLAGLSEGRIEGIELIRKLKEQGREEDADRVLVDAAYRDKLIKEFITPIE